jgi:hypothetical protein
MKRSISIEGCKIVPITASAVVWLLLIVVCAAEGTSQTDFQLLVDKFASDIKLGDAGKLRTWYDPKVFFAANLVVENGRPKDETLQEREAVLTYWSHIRISAIKIEVQKALAAPGAGKGFWTEESNFQITVDENPPRVIKGERTVIWQPNGNSWQVNEEFWRDMKDCVKLADGINVSCKY